jgi:hypothetical protein
VCSRRAEWQGKGRGGERRLSLPTSHLRFSLVLHPPRQYYHITPTRPHRQTSGPPIPSFTFSLPGVFLISNDLPLPSQQLRCCDDHLRPTGRRRTTPACINSTRSHSLRRFPRLVFTPPLTKSTKKDGSVPRRDQERTRRAGRRNGRRPPPQLFHFRHLLPVFFLVSLTSSRLLSTTLPNYDSNTPPLYKLQHPSTNYLPRPPCPSTIRHRRRRGNFLAR